MNQLGKIERIYDLRTIWPHEANDFTRWLANDENLTLLSDAVGIDIKLEEKESSVGVVIDFQERIVPAEFFDPLS